MSNCNLKIDLKARKDVDGQTFYVGKLKFPGTIQLKEGAVFLVFVSDKGDEQLQIALMDDKNSND
jgi:hypothetical protein